VEHFGRGGFRHGIFRRQQFEDAFAGGAGLVKLVVQAREGLDGRINHHDREDEREEIRRLGPLVGRQALRIKKHQRDPHGSEQFDELAGNFVGPDDAHELVDVFFGRTLELFDDRVFEVVGFDDPVAGEGFVHEVGQPGVVFLNGPGGLADFASVNNDGHDAHGKNHEGYQRQRGLQDQQDAERAKNGHRVFDGGGK
jgi:hypothetical protein